MVYAEEIDKKDIGESIIVKNGGIFYLIWQTMTLFFLWMHDEFKMVCRITK